MKSYSVLVAAIFATAGFSVSSNALASPPDTLVSEQTGDHPAVIVARTQAKRGIDPNKFILAHPAAPQLLAASPNAKRDEPAKIEVALTVAP